MAHLLQTPNHVRQLAIRDLLSARKAAFSNLRAGNIKTFEMKHRTRKDRTESIRVDNNAVKRAENGRSVTVYPHFCRTLGPIRSVEWVPPTHCEYKIHRDRLGDFYLVVPFVIATAVRGETQVPADVVIAALDPGVRTFQAFYATNGECGEIATGAATRLWWVVERAKRLLNLSQEDGTRHQRRRNLRRRSRLLFSRADHLVHDLHYKSSRFLCSRYTDIFVPSFGVSSMVVRELRKISALTTNQMLALCHYKFSVRIRSVAEKLGCRIHETSEWYTSKTCGACGGLHPTLGGSKDFSCPHCGVEMDRDLNGARNNLIRGLLFHTQQTNYGA